MSRVLAKGIEVDSREASRPCPMSSRRRSNIQKRTSGISLVAEHTGEDGHALVEVSGLLRSWTEERAKFTPKQSRGTRSDGANTSG